MSQDINTVCLTGELADEPDLRYTNSGTAIYNGTIKVTNHYQNDGEWQSSDSYFDFQAWGQLAERMGNSLREGQRIRLEGKLVQDIWDDNSGQTHYDTEVKVRSYGTEDSGQMAQPDPQPEPADQRRSGNQQGPPANNQQSGSNDRRGGRAQQSGNQGEQQETFEPDDSLPF